MNRQCHSSTAKVVTKVKLISQKMTHLHDVKPVSICLETLAKIRAEYHHWKGDAEPEFQSVFNIITAGNR
jgi:hypothetical protein